MRFAKKTSRRPYFEPVKGKETLRKSFSEVDGSWEQMSMCCTHRHTHTDCEGIKYFLSKFRTLSPALCRRGEDPTSHSYHTETLQASSQALTKIPPLVLSFPPYAEAPSLCCAAVGHCSSVCLQACPSASENLDSITNVFLMPW